MAIDEQTAYEQLFRYYTKFDFLARIFGKSPITLAREGLEPFKEGGVFDSARYVTETKDMISQNLGLDAPIPSRKLGDIIVKFNNLIDIFQSAELTDPYEFGEQLVQGLKAAITGYDPDVTYELILLGHFLNESFLRIIPEALTDPERQRSLDVTLSQFIQNYFLDELRSSYTNNDVERFEKSFFSFARLAEHRQRLSETNLESYLGDVLDNDIRQLESIKAEARQIVEDETTYNTHILELASPGNEIENYETVMVSEESHLLVAQRRQELYQQTQAVAKKVAEFFHQGSSLIDSHDPRYGIEVLQERFFIFEGAAPLVERINGVNAILSEGQKIIKSRILGQVHGGFITTALFLAKDRQSESQRARRLVNSYSKTFTE